MEAVSCREDIGSLDQNAIVGTPDLVDSRITFNGNSNILYCEEGVSLRGCRIEFNGSNSLVALGRNKNQYRLSVTVYQQSVLAFGRNCYMNGLLNAIASERCNIIIGRDCLFSFGIWLRTADPHLVYDLGSSKRINASRDILIGDHVWVGQSTIILKGSEIGSGSIVGAASVLAGKTVPSNSSWAGNPARQIKAGVGWDGRCVHSYGKAESAAVERCDSSTISFRGCEGAMSRLSSRLKCEERSFQKCEIIKECLYSDDEQNRFAIDASQRRAGGVSPSAIAKRFLSRLMG